MGRAALLLGSLEEDPFTSLFWLLEKVACLAWLMATYLNLKASKVAFANLLLSSPLPLTPYSQEGSWLFYLF